MASKVIDGIGKEKMKPADDVSFSIGDSVRIHVRIKEGDKERIQVFPGTVIARNGRGATKTFTVRRISHGVGVERVFTTHSPYIAKIEVEMSTHVRRSKLYFLRDRAGKKSRLEEKIVTAEAAPATA